MTEKPWITGITVSSTLKSTNDALKPYKEGEQAGFDMWAEWVYDAPGETYTYSTIVGVTCDWNFWQLKPPEGAPNNDTPLGNFGKAADHILGPLIWGVGYNDRTSAPSFDHLAGVITATNTWVKEQQKTVQGWADSVEGAGSEFQGSAAGRFKEVLIGLRNQLIQVHVELGDDADTKAQCLRDTADALRTAVYGLYQGYTAWRAVPDSRLEAGTKWSLKNDDKDQNGKGASFSWPSECVHSAFGAATAYVQPTMTRNTDGTLTFSFATTGAAPSPQNKEALKAWIDDVAKKIWTGWIQIVLDKQATDVMTTFKQKYNHATAVLQKLQPPQKWLPADKPPTKDTPNPPGTGDGGPGSGGPGGGAGKNDLNLDNKDKTGSDGGSGTGKIPPPPPVTVPGTPGGTGGRNGSGTGGQSTLLDGKGNPLLGKDGKPVTVPPGSTVNGKGEVIGPDGKPVLGKDGKPLVVPPGTTVGPPATVPGTGTGGGPFKVPVGSKRNDDGTVTGPDGKLLKDANGNLVVLGKDDTIDKDGTVLGPDGKPVPQFEQLMNDQAHALLAGRPTTGVAYPGGGSSGGGWTGLPSFGGISTGSGSGGLTTSFKGGTDLLGQPFSGSGGSGGRGTVAAGPPTLGVGGKAALMSDPARIAELAAEARSGRTVGGRAAAAAEESQLMGRGISTTGGTNGMTGPMMPPMGAGAGAGAPGQGEKERQRTTWLSEDEEVWGTDSGAVTGVIGR
ncbi:hypothetical protein ABZW03_13315 [Kitasatospora sp. NPDC004799]|uniref:hypothetical protein n=1 Tax=Kitasatospora sp. NPDC004799 TaxID=3154460 RepID=UPI0033AD1C74